MTDDLHLQKDWELWVTIQNSSPLSSICLNIWFRISVRDLGTGGLNTGKLLPTHNTINKVMIKAIIFDNFLCMSSLLIGTAPGSPSEGLRFAESSTDDGFFVSDFSFLVFGVGSGCRWCLNGCFFFSWSALKCRGLARKTCTMPSWHSLFSTKRL